MGKSVKNGEKSHSAEESIVKGERWRGEFVLTF